jgi:hypothetical protein
MLLGLINRPHSLTWPAGPGRNSRHGWWHHPKLKRGARGCQLIDKQLEMHIISSRGRRDDELSLLHSLLQIRRPEKDLHGAIYCATQRRGEHELECITTSSSWVCLNWLIKPDRSLTLLKTQNGAFRDHGRDRRRTLWLASRSTAKDYK